jgi:hypothetical protein
LSSSTVAPHGQVTRTVTQKRPSNLRKSAAKG